MEQCMIKSHPNLSNGTTGLLLLQLIGTLTNQQLSLNLSALYPADKTEALKNTKIPMYDFIIVGGGSAGCVVASRLSENANYSVLLVEAGENPSASSEVPSLMYDLLGTSEDYNYACEPQDNICLGSKDKRCVWPGGKALGGSSVINGLTYIPGNKHDYDSWAEAGNQEWAYEKVLPYLKKSQQMEKDYVAKYGDQDFGAHGLLTLRKVNYSTPWYRNIVADALEELGYPTLDAFAAGDQMGFGQPHRTMDYGKRMNVAKAFLIPAKGRKNLHVVTGARCNKFIIDKNVATGVSLTLRSGRKKIIRARNEVISSAGSIATPQLLMLSGIGPRTGLDELELDLVADLPVGENLQDHVRWTGMYVAYTDDSFIPDSEANKDAWYDFLVHGKGSYTTPFLIDFMGFINVFNSTATFPDIQFFASLVPKGDLATLRNTVSSFCSPDQVTDDLRDRCTRQNLIFLSYTLLHPKSIGRVKLRNTNPEDPVLIYPNNLREKIDVDTLFKTIKFSKTLLDTEVFRRYEATLEYIKIDACKDIDSGSREYLKCSLSYCAGSLYHPVGTAKMGLRNDPTAVVDSRLNVHGVDRLRVIDASIMPEVTSGNTNAPTIMIAEMGSDFIKDRWSYDNTNPHYTTAAD